MNQYGIMDMATTVFASLSFILYNIIRKDGQIKMWTRSCFNFQEHQLDWNGSFCISDMMIDLQNYPFIKNCPKLYLQIKAQRKRNIYTSSSSVLFWSRNMLRVNFLAEFLDWNCGICLLPSWCFVSFLIPFLISMFASDYKLRIRKITEYRSHQIMF